MSGPGLEELFDRYRKAGDLAALAEVFDRTADQLLKVAWHLSHDEAQAEDLVQSTFLAAIEHPERFDASREFVPWLVGILTNKAQVARALAARTPDPERLAKRSAEDPVDDTERRELLAKLEGAIERVPDAYREVLRIHLAEGKGAEEIAHEVKRPAGTVRVQLHRGLKELRRYLPAGFALGGVVVLTAPRGLAAMRAHILGHASALAKAGVTGFAGVSTAQIVGGVLVGKKIAVAVGVVLVGSGALWLANRDATPAQPVPVVGFAAPAEGEPLERITPSLAKDSSPAQRETASSPPAVAADDPYGSLDMEWSWADGTPAAGVGVVSASMGEENPYATSVFDFTDEHGRIAFEHLHEGRVVVETDRTGSTQKLETSIVRGRRTSERFVLPAGIDVRGRVVDKDGNPVAGADVWMTSSEREAGAIAAKSAADGSYFVRSVHSSRCLFATADRFGSSSAVRLQELDPESTGKVDLELRLLGESGALEGLVRDPDGKPITGAWVTVRCARSATKGQWKDWPVLWMATLPDGTFRFTGVHMGNAEVEVSVREFAVWVGQTLVEEDQTKEVDVRVEKGFTVEGLASTAEGSPVVGAYVRYGPGPGEEGYVWRAQFYAKTNAEGRYHLDFVPSGAARLGVESRKPGSIARAKTEVTGRRGDHVTWNPILIEGGKIVGRLVDESAHPIEGWSVEAQTRVRLEYSPRSAKTDAQGRFEILDCPDVPFVVAAYPPNPGSRFKPQAGARAEEVRPGKGDVLLTVTSTSKPTVYVRGRIVDEEGKALGDVQLWAHNEGTRQSSGAITDKEDGSFQVGPMPSGTYSISVTRKDFPTWNLDPIEIAPDEHRDVGTIAIQARGRFELVLRREDESLVDKPFVLLLKGPFGYPLQTADGFTFRSEDLYPGSYTLFPSGQNIATEQRTVQISRGETTRLELHCRPGVPQVFRFASAQGEKTPAQVRIVIRDAEGAVLLDRLSGMDISPEGVRTPSMVAGFAPGRYTYLATSTGWKSNGSFEVGESTPPNGIINAILVRTP